MPSPFAVPRVAARRSPASPRVPSSRRSPLLLLPPDARRAAGCRRCRSPKRCGSPSRRSPQLASQRAMVDAAREMAGPAGELPDPKLKLGVENVPTNGADSLVAHARLHDDVEDRPDAGIPARGKAQAAVAARRTRRRSAAPSPIEVGARSPSSARRRRRGSRAGSRPTPSARSRARSTRPSSRSTAATAAYRAGKAPQGELIAAQSMVVELRNRATEAAAQSKRARIALARYIGADAERPLGDAPDVARLPFDAARARRRRRAAGGPARAGAGVDRRDRGRPRARGEAARLERRADVRASAARRIRTWCR